MGRTAADARVNAHRGKDAGKCLAEDDSHRPTRGHAGDIDTAPVHAMPRGDAARQSDEQRWFAALGDLVTGVVPVPASQRMCTSGLFREQGDPAAFLDNLLHPRAGCEVGGALRSAVQHHEQRRPRTQGRREAELVAQAAVFVGVHAILAARGGWPTGNGQAAVSVVRRPRFCLARQSANANRAPGNVAALHGVVSRPAVERRAAGVQASLRTVERVNGRALVIGRTGRCGCRVQLRDSAGSPPGLRTAPGRTMHGMWNVIIAPSNKAFSRHCLPA